jgi:hypothetical protein
MTCYRECLFRRWPLFVRTIVLVQTERKNWRSRVERVYRHFLRSFGRTSPFFGSVECFLWLGGKYLECGSAGLSVNFALMRGHGSLLLDLYYWPMLPGCRQSGSNPRRPSRGTARRLTFRLYTGDGDESAVVASPPSASGSPADALRACPSVWFADRICPGGQTSARNIRN